MIIEDWQKGEKSITPAIQRIELMNEWLKLNKEYILSKKKDVNVSEEFLGGFED